MKKTKSCKPCVLTMLLTVAVIVGGLSVNISGSSKAAANVTPFSGQDDDDRLERIADRVENALRRDNQLSRYDLDADEENNTIEIEGTVRTRAERNRAYRIARSQTPRRYRVINKIRVGR